MDYLSWYRRVLDLPVENGVELVDLEGTEAGAILTLRSATGVRRLAARRVVLATGRDGLGGSTVPPLFRTLPPALRAHSSDPIDFAVLRGKRVAVVGAGASAVDNAAAALEAGAADVTMLVRRPDIPRVNKGTGVANPGLTLGFYDLPPARRWEMTRMIADAQVPPPRDSMLRASRHPGFAVRTDCPVLAVRAEDEEAVLTTRLGDLRFDFVILGTGFSIDWGRRPELSRLSPHVRLWRDVYVPRGQENHEFADHPFLGPAFEFLERRQGEASWISRIHCFNFAATLSHGKLTGDIPAISLGAERLGQGIARLTFVEDYPDHRQRLIDYDTPELLGDEWTREVEA